MSTTRRWVVVAAATVCLLPGCAARRVVECPNVTAEVSPTAEAEVQRLEEASSTLRLQLLERQTKVEALERQLQSQERMLDEAIREVVRSKSKLRSLDSRAEAASSMAEAELELGALRAELGGVETPELAHAAMLLEMSSTEFDRENFGGALYLTAQVKSELQLVRNDKRERLDPVEGETVFEQPIAMQALKRSNVRRGPGLRFEVMLIVDPRTEVLAYSHRGEWVRVRTGSGINGWVHETLVEPL